MIVDVHGHVMRNAEDLDWIVKSGAVEKVWLHALPEFPEPYFTKHPDLTFGTDEEVLTASGRYPHFFLPFGYLDFRKPPDAIDTQHEAGFVGLKAIFSARPYDDPSYMPYYERAQALKMPIMFHMGALGPVRASRLGEGLSTHPGNARPSQLFTIAGNFPELTVVGAHVGGLWQNEVLEGIRDYPNLYFDISGGDTYLYLQWLLPNLAYDVVPDKILTGIDCIYGSREYHQTILDKARFWELFFSYMGSWFSWTDEAEKILRLNAAKIQERMNLGSETG